jgi:GH18 family chitinase
MLVFIFTGRKPLGKSYVTVCYVAGWAYYRQGLGKFTVDDIIPTLCTHLVYAFAVLNVSSNSIECMLPEYDLEDNNGTGWCFYSRILSVIS